MIYPTLKAEYENLLLLLYCYLFLLSVVSICFKYLGAPMLGAYVFMLLCPPNELTTLSLYVTFFVSWINFDESLFYW